MFLRIHISLRFFLWFLKILPLFFCKILLYFPQNDIVLTTSASSYNQSSSHRFPIWIRTKILRSFFSRLLYRKMNVRRSLQFPEGVILGDTGCCACWFRYTGKAVIARQTEEKTKEFREIFGREIDVIGNMILSNSLSPGLTKQLKLRKYYNALEIMLYRNKLIVFFWI